jgi:Thioredoxin
VSPGLRSPHSSLGVPLLLAIVRYFGLSEQGLCDALAFGSFADKVRRGLRSGVNGTPTFFINNRRYDGPVSHEALVAVISAQFDHAPAPA